MITGTGVLLDRARSRPLAAWPYPETCPKAYDLDMSDADRSPRFSLAYEIQPSDVAEMYRMDRRLRRRRLRNLMALVVWVFLAAACTTITVLLDEPSLVRGSSGAPGWLYLMDGCFCFVSAWSALINWRLRPMALARRVVRKWPASHGVHREEVSLAGVTWTAPDGTEGFRPWAKFASVRETEHSFLLESPEARLYALTKRGLASPDLVPALREFLENAVAGQLPVDPSPAAAEPPPSAG
jgi:hypothetical protein